MGSLEELKSLATDAEWEVWYQDTFDRECPRQVVIFGQGLVEGLIELWSRHLYETVQANGQKNFSRFNLWWKQENKSIEVVGEWEGVVRLRGWVYEDKRQTNKEDTDLLKRITIAHKNQILNGETSEKILAAAKALENREEFEQWLGFHAEDFSS